MERIQTYSEFWQFYLKEHSLKATRQWHAWGLLAAILVGTLGCFVVGPSFVIIAILIGYGNAWYSHFFIEKNKPATFRYPFWSLISDFRLAFFYFTKQL